MWRPAKVKRELSPVSHVVIDVEIDDTQKARDSYSGSLMVRGRCAVCSSCWIYVEGGQGCRCYAGGPYAGYEKMPE